MSTNRQSLKHGVIATNKVHNIRTTLHCSAFT